MKGIKNLKFSSNDNEILIQYKFVRKYPNPKSQPYKNGLFLNCIFFLLNRIIKKKLKVTKFMKKKLYGGKLKEVNAPKIIKINNSK